jgi:hypothetical protein
MSRDDRPGESDENWKKRQDERVDAGAGKFQEYMREKQDKARPDGGDAADALADLIEPKDGPATHQPPADKGIHYIVGTPDHHEVAVHSDHAAQGDPFVAILVFADLMRRFQDAVDVAGMVNRVNDMLDGRPLEALRTGIAKELEKFSDTVEQALDDVQQRITELVSRDKTPEVVQPDAPAQEVTHPGQEPVAPAQEPSRPQQEAVAPEKAQDKAEPDAHDPAAVALEEKQTRERAELDQKLTAGRERLEARIADKPTDVRDGLRDSFNAAAKDARAEQATQHAEEHRKLKEQERPRPDHTRD